MALLVHNTLRRTSRRLLQTMSCCLQTAPTPGSPKLECWRGGHPTADVIAGGGWRPVRGFCEDLRIVTAGLSEEEFHHVADEALESMVERLEAYVEENDVDGGDVEYSQGVLTVKLGHQGTFVLNKQTPNRQIWLSSPVSGPFRFDFVGGRWVYNRDGRDLVRQLEQEIGSLVGTSLQLE